MDGVNRLQTREYKKRNPVKHGWIRDNNEKPLSQFPKPILKMHQAHQKRKFNLSNNNVVSGY